MSGRPPRLPEGDYQGLARISFTICTAGRQTIFAVRYIVANPIGAGLTSRIGEQPFAGSAVYTIDELSEAIAAGSPGALRPRAYTELISAPAASPHGGLVQ